MRQRGAVQRRLQNRPARDRQICSTPGYFIILRFLLFKCHSNPVSLAKLIQRLEQGQPVRFMAKQPFELRFGGTSHKENTKAGIGLPKHLAPTWLTFMQKQVPPLAPEHLRIRVWPFCASCHTFTQKNVPQFNSIWLSYVCRGFKSEFITFPFTDYPFPAFLQRAMIYIPIQNCRSVETISQKSGKNSRYRVGTW